jgi:predicted nucleotidyltransferase
VYRVVRRESAIDAARKVARTRYPDAVLLLVAGSIVRGEGTPHSDLDLVVVYPKIEAAFRESFVFDGLPVDTLVHDPETLHYFFVDVEPSGGFLFDGYRLDAPPEWRRRA